MSENTVKWHPYPQEKPKKDILYIVTVKIRDKTLTSDLKWSKRKFIFYDKCVTAWAEMPEPYKEENNG